MTSKTIAKPIKQPASQGGRVMRQEREAASVKSMQAAKAASTKKPSSKKSGGDY